MFYAIVYDNLIISKGTTLYEVILNAAYPIELTTVNNTRTYTLKEKLFKRKEITLLHTSTDVTYAEAVRAFASDVVKKYGHRLIKAEYAD